MTDPVIPTEPARPSLDGYRRLALAVIFSAVDDFFDPGLRSDAVEFFEKGDERYFVLAGIDRNRLYAALRRIESDRCADRRIAVKIYYLRLNGHCHDAIAKKLGTGWNGKMVKEFLEYF